MTTAGETIPPPLEHQPLDRMSWRRVLATGVVLFVATTAVMFATGNPNLYPTVILIGSFLVPLVFVAYLYDHQHWTTLTFEAMTRAFVLGGVLGVLGASVLEPIVVPSLTDTTNGLTFSAAVVVAIIEEAAKLLAVIVVARRMRHTGALDGLLLGAAVGMGFAALESTGYAFTVLMATGGDVPASLVETVARALLAPFGHGVWTAILGAVLFRTSSASGFRIRPPLIVAFAFVVALHAAWDGLPSRIVVTLPFGVGLSVAMIAISALGLVVLAVVFRWAGRQQRRLEAEGALPPPVTD